MLRNMTLPDTLRQDIQTLIDSDTVVLFMKGNRDQPKCGFSSTVVEILNSLVTDYLTVDVLESPQLRDGIKEFTDWPTIPQLYIKGEFVGGCDIIQEMFATGDLQKTLGLPFEDIKIPEITLTDLAKKAIENALEDLEDNEVLRLGIDARYEHALNLADPQEGDFVIEANGIGFKLSATRADGLKIDFIDSDDPSKPAGFDLKNPNMPPEVKDMSVQELKKVLEEKTKIKLILGFLTLDGPTNGKNHELKVLSFWLEFQQKKSETSTKTT